jgi:Domain of unknown function (DUF5668)
MNANRRHIDTDEVFWGLLLMAGGTALLLQRFHIIEISRVIHDFWPLIVIVIGISKLLHLRSLWSGLWMIAVGIWLEMVTLHLYDLTYGSSWPLLLVVLGAGMIGRTMVESFRRRDAREGENRHE